MSSLFKLLSFLAAYSRGIPHSRVKLVLVMVTGVLSGAASTGLIAVIHQALSSEFTTRGAVALPFIVAGVALPISRIASSLILIRLAQGMVFELRMMLSRRILAAPLRQLEKIGAPRLLAALTDDVGTVSDALANVPLFCMQMTVVLGCLGYMGYLSWPLLLMVLAVLVLGVSCYRLPTGLAQGHFKASRRFWDVLFKHFEALTEGIKELKLHGDRRRAFINDKLESTARSHREHNVTGRSIYAVANSWGHFLFFAMIGLLLFVAPGFGSFEPSVLAGYVLAILYMLTPVDAVLQLIPNLGRASVAVEQIESLGLTLARSAREEGLSTVRGASSRFSSDRAFETDWGRLEWSGVTHVYDHDDEEEGFHIGPIDFVLLPGEVVFFVGGNGSGKTTIAKLLLGLYPPTSGEIRVGGKPVTDATRDAYRQYFSAVFTDFYLFDSLLGLEAPKLDAKARRYLEQLHLDRKVEIRNGELSTVDLSQGQRKRLALLTAYLEDRPIYLFDEWAADQDPVFKEIFYRQLLPELRARGKTVVVISHDDRYYGVADRIVELEYGKIRFDGFASDYLGSPAIAPQALALEAV